MFDINCTLYIRSSSVAIKRCIY